MSNPTDTFTDEQKQQIFLMAALGCERETACDYLGFSRGQFHRTLCEDASFVQDLMHSESKAEVNHLNNLFEASRDPKNWRVSMWWLERRIPDRYGRRTRNELTKTQARQFFEAFRDILLTELSDPEVVNRVLGRLSLVNESFVLGAFPPAAAYENGDTP